jgi:predicted ATP-dependent endonuclease of OLD family
MLISEIGIRGFRSYGNNEQIVNLDTEKGQLILLVGVNGSGKSVVDSTEIEIDIPIEKFTLSEFISFLEIMGEENRYILYIKENNNKLYEEYVTYRNSRKD